MEPVNSDDIAVLSKPTGTVDDIVLMLANPRQSRKMVRFASAGSGAPTLLLKPSNDFTYDYTSAVNDKQIPAREAMFVLRRDSVVPLIYFQCNTAGLAWAYDWYSPATNNINFGIGPGNNYINPYNAHDVGGAGFSPHGSVEAAMKSKRSPHRYIFVDRSGGSGALLVTTADDTGSPVNVPAATAIIVKMYQWNGVEDILVSTTVIPAGSQTALIAAPDRGGYLRLEVFNSDIAAPTPGTSVQNIQVHAAGTCGCWGHTSINNINNIAESLSAVRCLTSTLKVSNASSPGFAAGMVYEADVFNGQSWQTLDQGSQAVGGLDTVQTRPAAKGAYDFCRVENLDDFDMSPQMSVNSLTNQGANSQQVFGDLDQDSPYKVIVFILPPPGNFPTDRFLNIELTSVIEGMGNTDLIEPEYPEASPEQWEAALLLFMSMPSGYENPTHWRDILAAIGKVGATVSPKIAEFLRSVQTGHPLVVAASQFGGNVFYPALTEGFKALQTLKRKKNK